MKLILSILLLFISHLVSGQLLPVSQNGNWGFIDYTGQVVIPIKYQAAQAFENSQWTEVTLNNQIGLAHPNGTTFFPPNLADVHVFHDSAFAVLFGEKWGVINQHQKTIVEPNWTAISCTPSGQFIVSKGLEKGLMNTEGQLLTKVRYNYIHPFRQTHYKALRGDTMYILDNKGNIRFTGLEFSTSFSEWPIAVITKNNRVGLSHLETGTICEPEWYDYQNLGDDLFYLNTYTKAIIFNARTGNSVKVPPCNYFSSLITGGLLIRSGEYFGVVTKEPKMVIEPIYSDVRFVNNCFLVTDTTDKMGVLNQAGKTVIPNQFNNIYLNEQGLFLTIRGSSKTLYTAQGKRVIPEGQYVKIKVFPNMVKTTSSNGARLFEFDDNWNVTDQYSYRNVRTIYLSSKPTEEPDFVPPPPRPLAAIPEGWVNARGPADLDNKWGFRDTSGRFRISPRFLSLQFLDNNRTILYREVKDIEEEVSVLDGMYLPRTRYGLASADGAMLVADNYWLFDKTAAASNTDQFIWGITAIGEFHVLQPGKKHDGTAYSFIDSLQNGRARVAKGGYIGTSTQANYPYNIKSKDNFRKQFGLTSLSRNSASDGYIKIERAKWGIVDSFGNVVVEPKFDFIQPFEQDRAIIILNDKWGVINLEGEYVIEPEFERIERIKQGDVCYFKTFSRQPRYGIIDTTGKLIIKPVYRDILPHAENRIPVKNKQGWTFIDYTGKPITDTIFKEVATYKNQFSAVKTDFTWKIIDHNGKLFSDNYQT
ncbi:MAG: WG repeat-containing protein, partial [Bacteroidetes bacterium]|nr:WG repeat-containing protein [Bacteroidota bacterium]